MNAKLLILFNFTRHMSYKWLYREGQDINTDKNERGHNTLQCFNS